jgi:hypothetical protein
MVSRIILTTAIAVVAVFVIPAKVEGWGAARVSATRVGPGGGVYHASRTVAAGPRGVYAGGRAGAVGGYGYGGAAYRGGAVYRGGAAYGGGAYYRGGYGGYGAAGYRYGYVR